MMKRFPRTRECLGVEANCLVCHPSTSFLVPKSKRLIRLIVIPILILKMER